MSIKANKFTLGSLLLLSILLLSLFSFSCVDEDALGSDNSISQVQLKQMQDKIDAQSKLIENFTPYLQVANLSTEQLTIGTYGIGNYPVIIELFGSSLDDGRAEIVGDNCVVFAEYQPNNSILYIIVCPKTTWKKLDTIELNISQVGSVKYATAYIGVR